MLRAILGGSFDPVHLGHVAMARHLLDHELAEDLLVVPAWRSPHKYNNTATPADRLAMARMAFDGWDSVVVDDREIRRGCVSFTVDTLEELAAEFPDDRFRLVIGSDNLAGFSGWRSPGRIQELVEIIVYPRDGRSTLLPAIERVGLDPRRLIPVTDFDHPVSSTTVRAMLARGILPDDQLPPSVAAYITARGLYTGR
jgi:nicotinate-nucleotide adenylyltransferase